MTALLITNEGETFRIDVDERQDMLQTNVFVTPGITCTRRFKLISETVDEGGLPVLHYQQFFGTHGAE